MRKFLLLSITLLCSFAVFSQDFSNKGKDFWFCFPNHIPSGANGQMTLWITSDQASSGTITMTNGTFSTVFNVAANSITPINIPYAVAHISNAESGLVIQKSIRVQVNPGQPEIVAYAQQYGNARSAATLLLPTNVMGKKYYAVSFTQVATSGGTPTQNARSQFQVIATRANTNVTVTPRFNGVLQTAFTISLPNVGDMYQYQSTSDITGTLIESIAAGVGGCNPIAVFSGSSATTFGIVGCTGGQISYDPLFQQLYPVTSWGKNFGFIPFGDYTNGNPYRVMASEDNTKVFFNGALVATLNAGEIYPAAYSTTPAVLTTASSITADRPITVAQYAQRAACSGTNNGDPDMVVLNPIEQNIKNITVFTSTQQNINRQWINVLLPTVSVPSFKIDGLTPSTAFVAAPNIPGYSYLTHRFIPATSGSHLITADSGFNAICYGFEAGQFESYAYSAGTYVRDLTQQLELHTTYGIETSPSVCTGAPFIFKVYFPDSTTSIPPVAIRFDSLDWKLSNPSIIIPNNFNIRVINPTIDSTNIRNGRQVNWYSIPGTYYFTTQALDTLTVTAYKSVGDGCGNQTDYDFPIQISNPPVADYTWTPGGCVAEPFQFTETTPQLPKPTYSFYWNFGDPASGAANISSLRNPTHTFSAPGSYTVKFSDITTPGCLSDTIPHTVTVAPLPSATISGTITACINTGTVPITFTGIDGTAPYTFYYHINAGPAQTINSVGTTAIFPAPTNTAGTFVYTLDSIRNLGSALCVQSISGQSVTVTITPDATIGLAAGSGAPSQTVCVNTAIADIVYDVSGSGTGAVPDPTSVFPPGVTGSYNAGTKKYTITGTPTLAGIYNYKINTQGPCQDPFVTGTITVTADGSIILSPASPGPANQSVCVNTPIANIIFQAGGSTTGVSVTGLPPGVTGSYNAGTREFTITGTPNPVITVSTAYLYSITTTGPCVNPPASGIITVIPDATISLAAGSGAPSQTVCVNTAIADIVYDVSGSGTGAVPDPTSVFPPGVTGSYNAGTKKYTITGTPTLAGVYNYKINTQGPCLNPFVTGTITVTADGSIILSPASPGPANQSVCVNTPIANIIFQAGGSTTGVSVTGLPPGVTGSYNAGTREFTITGTPNPVITVSTAYPYSITTTGPCVNPPASGIITVIPDATISLAAGSGAPSQTVCVNTAIADIVYDVSGSGTGAVPDPTSVFPPGVTGSYNAGTKKYTITGTPTLAGVYNYKINTQGPCQDPFVTGTITVTGDGSIILSPASPGPANQSVCVNTPIANIIFQASGTTTGASVTGLPPGVTGSYNAGTRQFTITGTPNPVISVTTAYPYSITTTGPCINPPASGIITVYALPTPDFTYTIPTCDTRTITFTDASAANSGALQSWNWNFGDPASGGNNTSASAGPVSHVFTSLASSPYTVTLTVNNSFGCTSNPIASKLVTVHIRPQAGFMIPEVCINDIAAVFTDTSKVAAPDTFDPLGWVWDFGDGSPRTFTQNGTHLYLATGIYNVMHIVTTNNGCRDTIIQPITINGANPVAAYTVNNPAALCANDSVAIVNQSTVNFGNVTKLQIIWDFVNQPAVVVTDDFPFFGKVYKHLYPNFQAPLTKNFTIRVRAFSGTLCFNDNAQIITVNAAPKVQFTNMPDTCLLAAPFQITQASEIGGVPGSGVFSGPGVSPTGIFSPLVAGIGIHVIKYTFTSSAGGCVDTMSKTIRVMDTAHAAFSFVSPICENTAASFTDLSTAPAGVVLSNTIWNFGDGSPVENHAPGSTFTHIFVNPGTFNVTMYNVSSIGCNSTIYSRSVTVDPNHHITFDATGGAKSQTVCVNKPIVDIKFTLSGGATGVTVTGLPGGMSYNVVGNILTITGSPNTAGSFGYAIQTTGNSCLPDNDAGTITVNPDHTITLTSPVNSDQQSVCVNSGIDPITYLLGGGATGVTSITGLPNGITYSVVGNTLTIIGTPTGGPGVGPLYPYTILTSGNGCQKANAVGSIAVNPFPAPNFSVDKSSYCIPNALVQFTNSSTISDGSPMTYTWNFGDGSSINSGVNPNHLYSAVGPFNVHLTATSTALLNGGVIGCSHDTIIVLNTIHPQPKADFTISSPGGVCAGDPVTFTDNSDGKDGVINQWNWQLGDGSIRNTSSVTYTYTDTVTYAVTLYTVNTIGCNSDTITKAFTVHPYPHVSAGPDKFILEGGSVLLESVTYGNDMQFLWTPNQYLVDNKVAQARVFKPLTDMTYTLTVTARGGCQASDQVFVKLLKFPVIPNTITPNGDGFNDVWKIDHLDTYPDNRVQVFTRTGQLVFESRGYTTPWDGTMKGKPLPVDTYYYIIEPGNGRDPITGYVTIIR